MEELLEVCREGFTPSPSAETVEEVIDFVKWIQPMRKALHGHSKPHQFKIVKEFGNVKLYAKMLSTSTKYEPEDGVIMLHRGEYDLGLPRVTDFKELPLQALRTSIEKLKRYLTEQQYEEWQNFFEAEEVRANPIRSTTWPAFLESLRQPDAAAAATDNVVAQELADTAVVEAKEDNRPVIYTGPYRNKSKDAAPLAVGDWAALESDGSDDLPFWVVKVISLDDGIRVHWHGCATLDGTGKWHEQYKKNTHTAYTDVVGEETVILFGFEMRKTGNMLFKKTYKQVMELLVRRKRNDTSVAVQL